MKRNIIFSIYILMSISAYCQSINETYFSFVRVNEYIKIDTTYATLSGLVAEASYQLVILKQSKISNKEAFIKELDSCLETYKDMLTLWKVVIDTGRVPYFSNTSGGSGSQIFVPLFTKYPLAIEKQSGIRSGFGPEIALRDFILVMSLTAEKLLKGAQKFSNF